MDALKKAAALAAVELVPARAVVGLGSGSTVAYAIKEIGERVRQGRLEVVGVPTSYDTRLLARAEGISLCDPMDVDRVDIALDGADEVDPVGNAIKGAGAAHVLEKIVAASATRFVVVADESKLVQTLGVGKYPVPVEVLAPALSFVLRRLAALGGKPSVRRGLGKLGPVISDTGHPIIDVHFGPIADAARLDHEINAIPGVVGHGLFVGMIDQVIVARTGGEEPAVETLTFPRVIQS